MSDATVLRLRAAVADDVIVARYWSHIRIPDAAGCWVWTGAISGKGHGRFQIADDYRPTATGRPAGEEDIRRHRPPVRVRPPVRR